MKTKIAVKGASFFAFHGYYPEEQVTGHRFEVDTEVWIDHNKLEGDNLKETVNYENLYAICKEEMKQPRKLLETVAYSIFDRIRSRYAQVDHGKVVIRKYGPQLGGKVEYTEIEVKF
jgi:dihydroneopterin aldolase